MPSEYCYEYPTRIHKIVIPTSSNSIGLFDIGSVPKIPGRFQPFRIPPPSDSFIGDFKSEHNLPIPPKHRIYTRIIKRDGESDFDSVLDPVVLKPWPILDIPRENVDEDVDCDDEDDDDDDIEERAPQRDVIRQSIPKTLNDFLLDIPPKIPDLPFPNDLLELSSSSSPQQDHSNSHKPAFELSQNAVSKVWVNPQYEAILKRKADEEGDSVDSKKRKTS